MRQSVRQSACPQFENLGIIAPYTPSPLKPLLWHWYNRITMEIVFVGNLLEATKDLEEGEILFCPMKNWTAALEEKQLEDKIGGVVEDDGQVRLPTSKEAHDAKYYLLKDIIIGTMYDNPFFYTSNMGWMRKNWEDLSEEIKRNEKYLKKEIVEDLIYIDQLFKYDYLLDTYDISGNSSTLRLIVENTKTIVEGEVRKEIVKMEKEKEEKYIEALSLVSGSQAPIYLDLELFLPQKVRNKGTEDYIKKEEIYKEATRGEKKVLMMLPNGKFYRSDEKYYSEVSSGMEVDYYLRDPKIDKSRVYVVLGEFKIPHGKSEMTYIFGFPFFRVKFSSVGFEFRSRSVTIRERKETEDADRVVRSRFHTKSFLVTLEYAKEPKVIEGGKGMRTIETDKSLQVEIRTVGRAYKAERYKVCDVEISKDGEFSVKTDYGNVYDVKITASDEAAKEVRKTAEEESRVFRLVEKWTKGKKTINSGRIIEEKVESPTNKKKVFVLKDKKYNDKENNEIDRYIKSKLEELIKNIIKEENIDSKKERDSEVISLKPDKREEIIREIQTGFVQDKVIRNLEHLEKIEELCFESREGEKVSINHPDTGGRREEAIKRAKEAALYGTGINVEGLGGEEKSIMEVLKLTSHSFPFLTQYSLKRILSELKEMVSLAFSKDVVPLKEVDVSIETINPSIHPLSRDPKVLALFSIEGDKVKVYINDGEEQNIYRNMIEYVKISVGNIEIKVRPTSK